MINTLLSLKIYQYRFKKLYSIPFRKRLNWIISLSRLACPPWWTWYIILIILSLPPAMTTKESVETVFIEINMSSIRSILDETPSILFEGIFTFHNTRCFFYFAMISTCCSTLISYAIFLMILIIFSLYFAQSNEGSIIFLYARR